MSEDEAYEEMKALRWPDGVPTCPRCSCKDSWPLKGERRWKCKGAFTDPKTGQLRKCYLQYTITSWTPLASHKMAFRDILAAAAEFINGVMGVAACRLKRMMGISYKTAFVLCHKIREAFGIDYDQQLEGVVEIDGAFVGSKKIRLGKPITDEEELEAFFQTYAKKQTSLVVLRDRPSEDGTDRGRVRVTHVPLEGAAVPFVRAKVKPGTVIQADYGTQWERLHLFYPMKRVNHSVTYSADGACTNWAESFFSRVRAAERGVYRYWSKGYAERYGMEMAWREENSRVDNGRQIRLALSAVMRSGRSSMAGYWQRHLRLASA